MKSLFKYTLAVAVLLMCAGLRAQESVQAAADASKSAHRLVAEEALNAATPIAYHTNDGVFACEQDKTTGLITVKYVWPQPAIVYSASLQKGNVYRPGRSMGILKIKSVYETDADGKELPPRS